MKSTNKPAKPKLNLTGTDSNAFGILSKCHQALVKAGRQDEWTTFSAEATSGDYEHLLATAARWFDLS